MSSGEGGNGFGGGQGDAGASGNAWGGFQQHKNDHIEDVDGGRLDMASKCRCSTPTFDQAAVDAWDGEFRSSIWKVVVTTLGAQMWADRQASIISDPTGIDPPIQLKLPGSNIVLSEWRQSEFMRRCASGGEVHDWVMQAWIVDQYGRWDAMWRAKLAKCASCHKKFDTSRVRNDAMGVLRRLRNDVCHHDAVATRGESGQIDPAHFSPPAVGSIITLTLHELEAIVGISTCYLE